MRHQIQQIDLVLLFRFFFSQCLFLLFQLCSSKYLYCITKSVPSYLFIDGKNCGTVLAQFMGRKPEGHGLFAMLVSEPPAGCGLKGKSILTFSSYIGKNGDEIYVVTPDDELPDRLEF